jgi:mannose-6-phosphate isomerase-like protein (cupin superfamily)
MMQRRNFILAGLSALGTFFFARKVRAQDDETPTPQPESGGMQAFELEEIEKAWEESGRAYYQFLDVPSMSMGLYVLPEGAFDSQPAHERDEVYYVVRGQATIRVGEEDRPVKPGSMVFVPAHLDHRFHSIEEELRVLVFFAFTPEEEEMG